MTDGSTKVQTLVALLRETGAKPRVSPERVVRSTLYDLDYHIALVACAFFTNGETRTDHTLGLVAHWLKLLQFVAVRPALLPNVQTWAGTRRRLDLDLDVWQKMPRGYLGDRTHDRTIDLLVAGNVLRRATDTLESGERFDVLRYLHQQIVDRDILASERRTLHELARLRVNKTLLRGA